ncbi:MAG: AprI/Inh family metalloprotease inhibitor [Pseudolabrys sp.]
MPAAASPTIAAALIALIAAGCTAGGGVSLGTSAPHVAMGGRWTLAAPNAPTCGVEFRDSQGGQSGAVTPDGGCPGNFYMSRSWSFEDGALTIKSEEDQTLAQLQHKGGHFEGKSSDGTPLTLTPRPGR